jgi:hypothetical protein
MGAWEALQGFLKMSAKYPDVLKFGRTLAKEGKDASNIVTSSMVMTVSIHKVDCHMKRDIGRSVLANFRVCAQRGAN